MCAMKIKMLSRNKEECTRERASDLQRVFRNPDPALHPFERAREYTRALNAAKLDKVFAKPFVSAMDGHSDPPTRRRQMPQELPVLMSTASKDRRSGITHERARARQEEGARGVASVSPSSREEPVPCSSPPPRVSK